MFSVPTSSVVPHTSPNMNDESATSACADSFRGESDMFPCPHYVSVARAIMSEWYDDYQNLTAIALKVQVNLQFSSPMSYDEKITVQRLAKEHYALERLKRLQSNTIDNEMWEMFPLPEFADKAIDIISEWNEDVNNLTRHASAVQRQYDYVSPMTPEQKAIVSFRAKENYSVIKKAFEKVPNFSQEEAFSLQRDV
jgi:hypothetical protein